MQSKRGFLLVLEVASIATVAAVGLAFSDGGEFNAPKPIPDRTAPLPTLTYQQLPDQHGGGSYTHYSDTGGHTPESDTHRANSDDHWSNTDIHWVASQHHFDGSSYSCHYAGSQTVPGFCN